MACADGLCPPPASNACFSPRFSFSRDLPGSDLVVKELKNGEADRAGDADFEFCMVFSEDPRSGNAMLPADELFFQGKLRPLQLAQRTEGFVCPEKPLRSEAKDPSPCRVSAAEDPHPCAETNSVREDPSSAPFLPEDQALCAAAVSKASSSKSPGRWKGLLGFRKLHISTGPRPSEAAPPAANGGASKSLKKLFTGADSRRFDRAISRSESSSSSRRGSNADSAPPRASISSSSSLPDLNCSAELPRRSVDSQREDASFGKSLRVNVEKPHSGSSLDKAQACPKRVSRRSGAAPPLDSPRISASGKIVFRNLERSSSSPSSFNRHARKRGNSLRHSKDDRKGLERSYSENIRISPVLHVPVGISPSFRSVKAASKGGILALSHLFSSPQKKENGGRRTRNTPCPVLSSTSVEGSKIFGCITEIPAQASHRCRYATL